MKIREYLTEEKIPSNVKKEIINMLNGTAKPKNFELQNFPIDVKQNTNVVSFTYPNEFIDLTFLLVDIADMLEYNFTKKKMGKNIKISIDSEDL